MKRFRRTRRFLYIASVVGIADVVACLLVPGIREVHATALIKLAGGTVETLEPDGWAKVDLSRMRVNRLVLFSLRAIRNLRLLNFENSSFADDDLRHIGRLGGLLSLELSRTQVSDVGLTYLRDLRDLRVLELDNTSITDAGLANLGRMDQLTRLSLNGTQITGSGLDSERLPRIYDLSVEGAPITDAGMARIGTLKSLGKLSLSNTKVTDAQMAHLKDVLQFLWLDVINTRVSDAGVKWLEERECSVRR